jgi:hypothetical protein
MGESKIMWTCVKLSDNVCFIHLPYSTMTVKSRKRTDNFVEFLRSVHDIGQFEWFLLASQLNLMINLFVKDDNAITSY